MKTRPSTWLVIQESNETYTVTRGNRQVATGLVSIRTAEVIVKSRRTDDEPVFLVEPDGYRTPLVRV